MPLDIQQTYRVEESPSGQWRVLGPGGWSATLWPAQWHQVVEALTRQILKQMGDDVGPDAVVTDPPCGAG